MNIFGKILFLLNLQPIKCIPLSIFPYFYYISLFRDILSPFLNIMSYLEDILFWTTIYPKTKISEISN